LAVESCCIVTRASLKLHNSAKTQLEQMHKERQTANKSGNYISTQLSYYITYHSVYAGSSGAGSVAWT